VRRIAGLALAALALAGCGEPPKIAGGQVSGRVRFEGQRPAMRTISMEAEEACAKMQAEPVEDGAARISAEGGVANVFVYVKRGLEGKSYAPPTETVVIEQKGCQFGPRVVGVRKMQTIAVKNLDPVTHNIHPMPKNNRDWNQSQAPGAEDLKRRFGFPEVMIPVKCNVHAWMRAYIAVMEHPFFAVTNEQGEFRLKDVPPGEYEIAAWHEQFGEKTQKVRVEAGGAVELPLSFVSNLP
jgi:plastocyanin